VVEDLVRWLGACLDEDERIARAAIRAVGDVPGAARWRFGNAYTDEGGTYWQITTMTPDTDGVGPVELVGSGMSGGGAHEPEIARHAVEHDPARVLREIDVKRKLIAEHRPDTSGDCGTCARPEDFDEDSDGVRTWSRSAKPSPCPTLRLLAAVYVDRAGYQESWRP
jgi:hypothetical protein